MTVSALALWESLSKRPGGKWAFSRLVSWKAPYAASIQAHFEQLRPGYCEVSMRKRRSVLNHLGTIHAIAMCNMAELAGGTMTDVTVPPTHRWIPTGMTVEYLKKATKDLIAIARFASEPNWASSNEHNVGVEISESGGPLVFRATISMRVTARDA